MVERPAGGEPTACSWIQGVRGALGRRYRQYMERREDRLASITTDRVVRPFEWGLDWSKNWPCADGCEPDNVDPLTRLKQLNKAAVSESAAFFAYQTPQDFECTDSRLRFTSAVSTPYTKNNIVHGHWFPSSRRGARAVLVLPHWNAQIHQHVSLCRALSMLGISALRLSLPYHDLRMPAELHRADYAVSSNLARTVDATRQAVVDARSCLDWLQLQGYESLGIVGTSLGSCYAFLTSAHDGRLRANVFNLFSLYFADVVWTGLTTRHVRQALDGQIELEQLRSSWEVITPYTYLDRYAGHGKKSLFIYGTCDTTFLPKYCEEMIEQARQRQIPHELVVLPCGHYTLGKAPFKFIDGYQICSFLLRSL
jgi:hypothetical protein